MIQGLKFEPRTTAWTRDDVNQVNKLLQQVQTAINAIPAPTSGTAAAAPSSQVINIENTGVGPPSPTPPSGTSVQTDGVTISGDGNVNPIALITPVTIPDGGTGTSTPALIAGTGISITGSWPDNTISATGATEAPCDPQPMTVVSLASSYSPYTQLLPFFASTQFDCIDAIIVLPFSSSPYSASF